MTTPRRTVAQLAGGALRALELADRVTSALLDCSPVVDLSALESPQDKVLAETALLVRAAAAVPPDKAPGLAARAHDVASRLRVHASSPRIRAGITLHPALARDYALAHRCLLAMGHPDDELEQLLLESLDAPSAVARERLPHRELEQGWIDHLVGRPLPDDTVARTALGRGIDVLTGSRDDWYALTHAVLYATDLGSNPGRLPRERAAVLREAESAMAGALDDDDFDLAGELVMLWPMLGAPISSAASFVLDVLCDVEAEAGLLPSLAIDGPAFREHEGPARTQFAMATSYHTAYVMGLVCTAFLRCPEPEPRAPWPPPRAGLLASAKAALGQRSPTPQWMARLDGRTIAEQQELTPFLLDVALRRAIRRFDLCTAHRLIVVAAEHELWTAAVEQAARLLSRTRRFHEPAGLGSTAPVDRLG